ncbi:HEPN domain-containing protein [Vulcanococcus limneticus Candia 3F8]|nr:HEPN domain-containing protein [Vulcanococcus limneticus MW73D5]MCP9893871.1 HEPN domain-containing protein [Vulcanococcus limneticus Candia 3F8]MCP9897633.1 HEPN domain-containing protein [Vulcanococcus limneticus Candia 3B3]
MEKALKAWLLQLGGDPPLTHDLRRLLLLLGAEGRAGSKYVTGARAWL